MADHLVVGVGASAGGLEALEKFFDSIPSELNAAFIVVQHLSPDHKSLMADLLSKHTSMPVREAVDGQQVLVGTVTMVPPHANLELEGDRLRFRERMNGHSPNLPINLFFHSLAETYAERAVGVVLSGTGSDGRDGIKRIKEAGGVVLAQDPSTARFDGMPLASIATGLVDLVTSPEAMGQELLALCVHGGRIALPPNDLDDASILAIQAQLLDVSGIDFSEYKRATVMRRVAHRMATLGVPTLGEYRRRLELDRTEVTTLSRELLINVTQFFRDPEVFEALKTQLLPQLCMRSRKEPLRAWVAGCSTGEEAYSLAMLLAEAAPKNGFKIFATDVDTQAIEIAAQGVYRESDLADIKEPLRSRYFQRVGSSFQVDRELRRHILFAPHNVARDPPFTRLDLVSCRNMLIYLLPAIQKRVLATFAFALKSDGVLVLGSSESLGAMSTRFRTVDERLKLYQRLEGPRIHLTETMSAGTPARQLPPPPTDLQQAVDAATRVLLDGVVPAAVLTNEALEVLRVFGNAERLLSLPVGLANLQLTGLVPQNLQTITSLATHRALTTNADTVMATPDAESGVGAIRVQPFVAGRSEARYLVISFERSVSQHPLNQTPLTDEAERQMAELQRELLFVRESLQATIEELETSNEELQATNEELLAANEELQSTNEELQSVNEELNTINTEHQSKIAELVQTNTDLDNLIEATTIGTIFLDANLMLRRFTRAATLRFSLLARDIGRPIEHITHQFKDFHLLDELRRVQQTKEPLEREVSTVTGDRYVLHLTPYLTESRQVSGVVVSFVDVTKLREEEHGRARLQQVIDSLHEQVAVVDAQGTIRFVNRAWNTFANENAAGAQLVGLGVGANYLAACLNAPEAHALLRGVLSGGVDKGELEYPCHSPTEQRWFRMYVRPLGDGSGAVISHLDVTENHRNGDAS